MINKVLITGGTGSLGKAVTRELLKTDVEQIRIYSRGEYEQEKMAEEIQDQRIRFIIGDVRDTDKLETAIDGVDSVVHCAALKVVPIVEYNPLECVKTNVDGTANVCRLAHRSGVKRVLFVSSDKAVNPVNIYGASKMMGENITLDFNRWSKTVYSVVRFGNLVGSRGSVVEKWLKAKEEGRPYLVTDWNMTRYWIRPEIAAVNVMRVLKKDKPGIYIPVMEEVSLHDVFVKMGLDYYESMVIGVREGEKIHEELTRPGEKIEWIGGDKCVKSLSWL